MMLSLHWKKDKELKKELSKVKHRKITTILTTKKAILIAKIAMLEAKIIISISKNSEIFREYSNAYS